MEVQPEKKALRTKIVLAPLIIGFSAPDQVWGQEVSPTHVISFLMGSPIGLGLGLEYERALSDSHSLALEVAGNSLLGLFIEEDDVIQVQRQLEMGLIYRYYESRKAPFGGYGLLGVGFFHADTTGGDLALIRFLGGGGYKWRPAPHFTFSLQGGVVIGNEDEISQDRLSVRETVTVGPFAPFLSLQLGFAY